MAKYPHAKNSKNPQSRSWGKCITERWTDRWADEQDWFYRTPTAKLEVQCFLVIREKNLEIINTRKTNTINAAPCSKSSKTMILSKLKSDNFHIIYFNVADPLINPFSFPPVIVKELIVRKTSVMKIQNLVVNPKSEPVKSNSKQYQFLFKYVSSENQWQNF